MLLVFVGGDVMDNAPIEELEYITSQVIDIGDFRVARGQSRRPVTLCEHKRLTYDLRERRVWCEDCETTIGSFDAFMLIVEHFQAIERHADSLMHKAMEAQSATLHMRAAKHVEKVFRRRMAISCPLCHDGITADDLLRCGEVSLEIVMARRAREKKLP